MDNKKTLSSLKLVFNGYIWVNIPILIIILSIAYFGPTNFSLSFREALIVGIVVGWIYWYFTIQTWVLWALNRDVNPDRLLAVGRLSLLLWNKYTIDKVLEKYFSN